MLEYRTRQEKEASKNFFTGCAVSPFKQTEAETFTQYFKLCKKVGAGAEFAITQVGYDARKFEELIRIQKISAPPFQHLVCVCVKTNCLPGS
jgi:5,10-methylenetetrahydrofolate reductase